MPLVKLMSPIPLDQYLSKNLEILDIKYIKDNFMTLNVLKSQG